MGKKSRREREKRGKTPEDSAAAAERAFIANSLAGVESMDGQRVAAARSELPNWETDEACLAGLKAAGFVYAAFTVTYEAAELCTELQAVLGPSRTVVDCTSLLPCGCGADHHVFPREIHRLNVESMRDDSYFVFVRTCENTAAFLAGIRVYLQAGVLASIGVRDYMNHLNSPTPNAIVIDRGIVHMIPVQASAGGSAATAGKMVAALIKKDPDMATCGICGKSFFGLSKDGFVERLATAIAGDCSHLLHENCVRLNLSLKGDAAKNCPTCDLPLPLRHIPPIYRDSLTLTLGEKKKFAVEPENSLSRRDDD